MGKWFQQFEALIWAASIALISLVYIFQAFATKEYVDAKHENVVNTLIQMQSTLDKIDQRTYEMAKERH